MVVSRGAVQMMKATLDACVIPKAVFSVKEYLLWGQSVINQYFG